MEDIKFSSNYQQFEIFEKYLKSLIVQIIILLKKFLLQNLIIIYLFALYLFIYIICFIFFYFEKLI